MWTSAAGAAHDIDILARCGHVADRFGDAGERRVVDQRLIDVVGDDEDIGILAQDRGDSPELIS